MDKKNRTGLQSKISHIFAGVPMPRKRKPLSEHPEPEKKDETSELLSPVIDDIVEEKTVDEQTVDISDLEKDRIEEEFSQETLVDQPQDLQQQTEDESTEEQFTIVSEPDFTEEVPQREEKADKVLHEKEISDSESQVVISEDEVSLESLMTPHPSAPPSEDREPQVQQPVKEESRKEKAPVEKTIPVPPVKESIAGKTAIPVNQKLEMPGVQDTISAPKPPLSKIPRPKIETKKDSRISKKTSLKVKGKHKKSPKVAAQPRQKIMVALVIVFSIILVLVLLNNSGFFASNPGDTGTAGQPGYSTASGKNTGNLVISWSQPPVYPDEIRDPMKTKDDGGGTAVSKIKTDFVVTVISIVDGQYLATIDGERKRKGDMVGDAKIIEITKNSVVFERNGKSWTQIIGQE